MPRTIAAQETRELVLNFFPPERRAQLSVQSLATSLEKFIGAVDLATRLDAFAELKEWSTSISPSPAENGMSRLETVFALVESQDELRVLFQHRVREILAEVRSVELFAE